MDVIFSVILLVLGSVGVAVSVIGVPGALIMALVLFLFGIVGDVVAISTGTFVLFLLLSLASVFIDDLAMLLGVRIFGASRTGALGAIAGSVIGFLAFGPIGMIVGAFVGTLILEYSRNPNLRLAMQKGFGTLLGYLSGLFLKFVITLGLFIWYVFLIW